MNLSPTPRNVVLTIEWEYIPGIPTGFDVVFPIWLDVKGNCLNESTGVTAPAEPVFTAKSATGWTVPHAGDLILMVPHIHDGNTNQQIFLDGKKVCENIPGYGETAEFVSHNEGGGHGHDHGTSEHTYHVSSITQCVNVGKVVPGNKFTITSSYDMKVHTPMKDHHGELEPIMGIEFLHLARPQEEGIKDILAMKNGDLDAFTRQVRGGGG
jgi:hypothetical protein